MSFSEKPVSTLAFARACFSGTCAGARDDLSSNRHPALHYWWSMIPAFAGTSLFRKPVSTFRDHALSHHLMQPPSGRAVGQEPGGSFAKVRRQSIFRSNGSEYALLLLHWRMFLSENRYPLFRNMRQPHS